MRKFGTSENPIIQKEQISARLLLNFLSAIGKPMTAIDVSKLPGRKTLECYLNNVITNPALNDLGVVLALWLRQNISNQGDVLQLSNARTGRLDQYVGEHVRPTIVEQPPEIKDLEKEVSDQRPEIVAYLDELALLYIRDCLDAYKHLKDKFTIEELEDLISAAAYCFEGIVIEEIEADPVNLINAEKKENKDILEDKLHESIKWFFSLNIRRFAACNAKDFLEVAGTFWSRNQVHDFALENLEFDDEDLVYFEGLELEGMLDVIKDYYFIQEKNKSTNRGRLAIYFKGSQPLFYDYDKNGINSLVRSADIYEKLNLEYERDDFYEELKWLHECGYITLVPVNYSNSIEAKINPINESDNPDFVYIKINSYMSKKDFSSYWLDLMAWNEEQLKKSSIHTTE